MSQLVQRQTIIFFLPLEIEALRTNYNAYSAANELDEDYSPTKRESAAWSKRQLYINPQSVNSTDAKIVQKQLTKGGYVVQYWGEELTTLTISGETGSAGVEGINILRDIYRHEQLHYRKVLADRQRKLAAAAAAAAKKAEEKVHGTGVGGFLTGTLDTLTGGGFSQAKEGISNTIDTLFGSSAGSNFGGSGGAVEAVPTLAAFATNIDMYFQGEFFRGYFTNFTVTEQAQQPGHFSYSMNFTVTRRSGKRTNFMPWHRSPLEYDGETVMSQRVTESKGSFPGVDRLSFQTSEETWNGDQGEYADMLADEYERNTVSKFRQEEREEQVPNNVPIRRDTLK